MSRQLYERWLIHSGGETLSEFVASERQRQWQIRRQREWARHVGPLMQQASTEQLAVLQRQMQGVSSPLTGLIGGLLGGSHGYR